MSDRSATVTEAVAFAPAAVGNVAVGFDILGHAIEGVGDRATVRRIEQPTVRIADVRGLAVDLPREAARNTATVPLIHMRAALGLDFGFEVELDKGIPLGSGMGGSAASAVAAVVAANALLPTPLSDRALLQYALAGETLASGAAHADNAGPSLLGGMVLATLDPPILQRIPVPEDLICTLVHPHMSVETRQARSVLKRSYGIGEVVAQTSRLAGLLVGCYANDLELIRRSLADVLVEPQRAPLIPGFGEVKRAALAAGALGCSISGGGPSVFAWCERDRAEEIGSAMSAAFQACGVGADVWTGLVDAPGAAVCSRR